MPPPRACWLQAAFIERKRKSNGFKPAPAPSSAYDSVSSLDEEPAPRPRGVKTANPDTHYPVTSEPPAALAFPIRHSFDPATGQRAA